MCITSDWDVCLQNVCLGELKAELRVHSGYIVYKGRMMKKA